MALRGNLKDFSLPDVFQLVTFSRKTGVLRITRADGSQGSVWFREGDVFFASSNWHSELLGERLVKAERITDQALKRALGLRADEPADGRRLGQILIQEGYVTAEVLESFVSEQIQDTIFDLMRWDEGEFDFEAMPEVEGEDIGLAVSMENVVMEGSRRLEEWNRIKKKIPSTEVVFKMATAPGEGTYEISLKPAEWQLLLLIDGSRSVSELAVATERTDFEVARVIYGLFSAGLLEFATDEEIARNREARAKREVELERIAARRREDAIAAARAAQEREAALADTARRRREQEQTAASAPAAPREAESSAPSAPAEMPEFLGGPAHAPSDDDQAVLAEFMGAVLEHPAGPAPAQSAPAAARTTPYVPAEEPAFFGASTVPDEDSALSPIISVEDLFPDMIAAVDAAAREAETSIVEPAPVVEGASFEFSPEIGDIVRSLSEEPSSAPEVDAQPSEADFERDLMALGLGELPSDLLSPIGGSVDEVAEPMSAGVEWVEAEPSQTPVASAGTAEASLDEFSALGADFGLVGVSGTGEPVGIDITEPPAEVPDFSALLESLDIDAPPAARVDPMVETVPVIDFDEELLREDTDVTPAGAGVISTDAFLEDIEIGDFGFSGGLNDELSALTGLERRQNQRPQASVKAIPEAGHVPTRDTRVDKQLLLQIIEGVKGL